MTALRSICREKSAEGALGAPLGLGVTRPHVFVSGFTLIELMVVVAIMILTLAVAFPALREVKRSPIAQAIKDIEDLCREARLQAILRGKPTQLVIRDGGAELIVEMAPEGILGATNGVSAIAIRDMPTDEGPVPIDARWLHDEVGFRALVVNQRNFMEAAATAIRFYPNGTCDQFDAEIQWLRREARRLSLEVMTGLLTIEDIR